MSVDRAGECELLKKRKSTMVREDASEELRDDLAALRIDGGAVEDEGLTEEEINRFFSDLGNPLISDGKLVPVAVMPKKSADNAAMVISYLRFSRLEQKKGDSIRRQLDARDKWLEENDLALSDHFKDEGVSAYRGRNATTGDLARLLGLIQQSKIPAGSILLVESLDRLSRNDILPAINLFTGIINAGVKVVTLADRKQFTRESVNANPMDLMWSIMVLMRANEESRTKGMRSAASWERKRKQLLEGSRVVATRMMPAWLEVREGKIVPVAWKTATVKRMFALAIKGYGLGVITRMFNRDNTRPIGRGGRWHSTYVHGILRSRAVIGEFEIHTIVEGKRKQVGVVKGYYPAIVARRTFDAVQGALNRRRSRRYGGPSAKFTNIFNGLLYDEMDEPWTVYEKKSRFQREIGEPYRCLVSLGALLGRKPHQINLRLCVFETAFFDIMITFYASAFMASAGGDDKTSELTEVQAQITETDLKVQAIQEQMMERGAAVGGVVQLLAKLEAKRQSLTDQLQALQRDHQVSDETRVMRLLKTFVQISRGRLDDAQRTELQAILGQLIKRITLRVERGEDDSGKKTITGNCRIDPIAGDPIDFVLTYRPYAASRKKSPLSRASWRVLSPKRKSANLRWQSTMTAGEVMASLLS